MSYGHGKRGAVSSEESRRRLDELSAQITSSPQAGPVKQGWFGARPDASSSESRRRLDLLSSRLDSLPESGASSEESKRRLDELAARLDALGAPVPVQPRKGLIGWLKRRFARGR